MLRGKLRADNLETARDGLILLLRRFASTRKPVVVYFDARLNTPKGVPRRQRRGSHVEIHFVPSADEAIRARLRREADISSITVVSHDQEVCGFTRRAGARVTRVVEFLEWLQTDEDGIDPLEPREKYDP